MNTKSSQFILVMTVMLIMAFSSCTKSLPSENSSTLSSGSAQTTGSETSDSAVSGTTVSSGNEQSSKGGTISSSKSNSTASQKPGGSSPQSVPPKPTAKGKATVTVTNSLETVTASFSGGTSSAELFAAKGESESAQLIIDGPADGTIYLENSALTGPQTLPASAVQLRAAALVQGKPEALIPVTYCPTKKGQRTVVWVTVSIPQTAKAGEYQGKIKVYTAEHQLEIPLSVTVAGFALPVTPSIPATMGIWDKNIRMVHMIPETKPEQIKQKQAEYFEFLLGYRMSPYFFDWYRPSMKINAYSMPGGVLDASTLNYAKDPRLAALMLAYFPLNESEFREQMKFAKNNGVLDKNAFYLYDEIVSYENIQVVKESAAAIKQIEPKSRILTTYFTGPSKPGGNDQWYNTLEVPEVLRGATDIFCLATHASSKGDETIAEKTRTSLKNNEQFWTYVCNMPGGQYPNLHLEMSGFSQRAVIWRNYAEQAPGFLYWSVNHYNAPRSKPNDSGFFMPGNDFPDGDGVLMYDGSMFPEYGYKGLVASVRLERLRDSLEDYEYFHRLEQVKGKSTAAASFKKIYVRPTGYMRQYPTIEAVRREVASLIG